MLEQGVELVYSADRWSLSRLLYADNAVLMADSKLDNPVESFAAVCE